MISEHFKSAIVHVGEILNKNKIRWAIIGSTNGALQGMEVVPKDLDIAVHVNDLKKIPSLFKQAKPSDVQSLPTTTGMPAWDVKMVLDGIDVQFVGEEDQGLYVRYLVAGKTTLELVGSLKVPCLVLEGEIEAYEWTHRPEKAQKIREFLGKLH